ncbi:MAG: hypothetical protein ABI353_15760 [Isosphaeraceae bacterium]
MSIAHIKPAAIAFLIAGTIPLGIGCEARGPAERTGEKIDRGIQNVKDTIDPPGPIEKAGRAVDKVFDR